jgi:acetyl-CoA C-acetyltransferase
MREAVIVSTARTPLTKAHRGEFNITPGPTLAAFAVRAAVERSGIDPALIEDAILGCGYPEGTTGRNVARQSIVRAGLPITIAGTTVNRFCASGLQAIAMAAGRIVVEGAPAMIAGGVESISQIRTRSATDSGDSGMDPWIVEHKPALYMAMIETADIVAQRYGIGREAQDRFSAESQRKTEEAQLAGRYKEEIVACTTTMAVTDKDTKEVSQREVTIDVDTCNRRGTTYEALAKLQPVMGADKFVTAGNASQLSDGASACVLMEAKDAERANLQPLGAFRGLAIAGCEPDEMGIGPVFAGAETAGAQRPEGRRYRPLGTQRGLCFAVHLLPAAAGHSGRAAQCRRRRDLDRPPLRHDGRAAHGPCADRRQAARREVRGRHDVHRRRHGRRGLVRNLLRMIMTPKVHIRSLPPRGAHASLEAARREA